MDTASQDAKALYLLCLLAGVLLTVVCLAMVFIAARACCYELMGVEPPLDTDVPPTRLGQPQVIRFRPVDHVTLLRAQYNVRFLTIVVRDATGVGIPIVVDVKASRRVRMLKLILQRELGVPVIHQQLTFRGEVLDDFATFEDTGFANGDCVDVELSFITRSSVFSL